MSRCQRCGSVLPEGLSQESCPHCLAEPDGDTDADAGGDRRAGPTDPSVPRAPPGAGDTDDYEDPAEPEEPDVIEGRLPGYGVLRLVGRGGMGAVYEGRKRGTKRRLAIKVLAQNFAQNPEHAERFARETKALSRLSHPGIVEVLEVGESCGMHYFVMEYVAGGCLAEKLEGGGRPPPPPATPQAKPSKPLGNPPRPARASSP